MDRRPCPRWFPFFPSAPLIVSTGVSSVLSRIDWQYPQVTRINRHPSVIRSNNKHLLSPNVSALSSGREWSIHRVERDSSDRVENRSLERIEWSNFDSSSSVDGSATEVDFSRASPIWNSMKSLVFTKGKYLASNRYCSESERDCLCWLNVLFMFVDQTIKRKVISC